MPELAEVDYYRKQWNPGLGRRILEVRLHAGTRLFRGVPTAALAQALAGATYQSSQAHGKRMLFRFTHDAWLGLHLGMTGSLRVEPADFAPGPHDHLVLMQARQALVFRDPRQFGRVQWHQGADVPSWWRELPPELLSEAFTPERVAACFRRHRQAPLKAVLLGQETFPGVGNWMADEILWRARLHPGQPGGGLTLAAARMVWRETRRVAAAALRTIGVDYRDPPKTWLFLHRWRDGGRCPRDQAPLRRAILGGRTTCWCPRCQGC